MPHPHQAILEEYQFALNHLAPTVPDEVKTEGQKMHDALVADENASEDAIREAMFKTGRAEYPHRHAHKELTEGVGDAKRVELVLEHVDETVRGKLKPHLDAGVPLDEIVRSGMFETDFTGEERYQVEDAILDAADHVKEEMADAAKAKPEAYAELVKKWDAHAEEILKKVTELESLENRDPKWRDEIKEKVARFREGFLVTEGDPQLVEVEKEIEYWRGTLGEEM